jgi:hypothetical protein
MWMGMTSKSNHLAILKTLVFVQVIPWFVITFASIMGSMLVIMPGLLKGGLTSSKRTSASVNQIMVWFPFIMAALAAGLSIGKDIGFFVWARRNLYRSFRAQAALTLGQPRFATLPLAPRSIAPPPIIPAQP